jgi:hypothetical protein
MTHTRTPDCSKLGKAMLQLCLVSARNQASRVTGEVRKLDHEARES